MRILIVGAGPAGLYLAYLLKRREPRHDIRIVEQNPRDATFGFGVVFSDRALDFLRDDDEATHAALLPLMQRWSDLCIHHRGERIAIDGTGFAAVGRLELLQLLQRRLASVGVTPEYGRAIGAPAELDGADLVVGADGANSMVRSAHAREFGSSVELLANHFAWFGTSQVFDTLSQTFVEHEGLHFNAHHYRYAPGMSTFIVECDPASWHAAGFERMDEAQSRAYCERVFAASLGGRPLLGNRSIWRRFPQVRNARWWTGNRVLIGDALRTAHFSIGSGTRLAFEDAIALAKALAAHTRDLPAALAAFESARRPIVDKIVTAASASAAWYEDFARHMQLAPWELAYSYIQRSGRVDAARLEQASPRFMAGYRRHGGMR